IQFVQVDSLLAVLGDRDRLQQIIGNLLSNAIKFTPQGGQVEVRLEEDWGLVGGQSLENPATLAFVPTGVGGKYHRNLRQYALITVKDSGIGIGAEFLPHVFEGFRQADGSITKTHGGLGLGLTIARYLTELQGGTIEATSGGVGEGAIFRVKLPLVEKVDDRALAVQPKTDALETQSNLSQPVPLAGVRILVVDDDADTCELIATVLGQCGAIVKTAASAKLALESMELITPDVLVSDIGMPDQNGYDLIRKVRELEAQRGGYIPAIALTAYARAEDRQLALQAGFQLHFPKPVEPAKLVAVLADLAGPT
ncbi:MAG TPA: ATP-binding protein, partial [Kamptonema sp.]|nr:ATP-binding protein [Kamptonema sp.]